MFGATDGEISLDITGGAGNYQYTWYSVDTQKMDIILQVF